jgi:hypothetical protein
MCAPGKANASAGFVLYGLGSVVLSASIRLSALMLRGQCGLLAALCYFYGLLSVLYTARRRDLLPLELVQVLAQAGDEPPNPERVCNAALQLVPRSSDGLADDVPTAAEWDRFVAARHGDSDAALEMWKAHVAWRRRTLPLGAGAPAIGNGLPDYVMWLDGGLRCHGGGLILLTLAAMYESRLGSPEQYATALAALLDSRLPREGHERVTMLIDVRGGHGWPNPRPSMAVVRALQGVLRAHFPERLHLLVVYPMPWCDPSAHRDPSAHCDPSTQHSHPS